MKALAQLVSAIAASCAVFLVTSCGEKEQEVKPEAGITPWGLPATAADPGSLADCDTVIVIALDKVLMGEVASNTAPHLSAVAAGAMRVADAVTTSTAGNAALASLLTGRHVMEHGIISLRDKACQTLPASEHTLAEGFAEAGWTTAFSSGNPLHARGFSGFAQGFDHYEAPRLAERSRPSESVANGALLPLKKALAAEEPVFVCVSFDDLTARSLRVPDPGLTATFVRTRLAPLVQERADVEAALRVMDADPAKGLDDLAKMLARARGSRASIAWNMALRDAHMAQIDRACGGILDALEAAGRQERALVVVTGLRGTLPPGYRPEAGAQFTADAIRVPMWIRWPHGLRRGEALKGTATLLDLPRALAAVGGFELQGTDYSSLDLGATPAAKTRGRAMVVDSQRRLFAGVSGDWHLERYSDGSIVNFNRTGQQARSGEDPAVGALSTELQAFAEGALAVDLSAAFSAGAGIDGLSLSWAVGGGAGRVLGDAGSKRPAVRGEWKFGSAGDGLAAADLRLVERAAAVRLQVASEGKVPVGPDFVRLGAVPLAELPVMMAPSDDVGELDPEAAPARLRLERSDGLWWTLNVDPPQGAASGGEVEVLVSVWPPRDFVDDLEVSAGGSTRRHDVPGRADMVRITGPTPLVCRVKKLGKEDFVVACRASEGFLAPTDMEFNGLRFADPHVFEFVVPRWQGAASPALEGLNSALYGDPEEGGAAVPGLVIRRSSLGPLPGEFTLPEVGDLAELVRLVPGE